MNISWPDIALSFLAILLEGAPFLLIGALISGFIDAFVPSSTIARFLPKKPLFAVLLSACLGIFLPLCECAAVPVIRRMLRKGLPLSCAITYMLAAPVVSPIVWFSTWKAFGFLDDGLLLQPGQRPPLAAEFAHWRTFMGICIASLTGWLALKISPSSILQPKLLKESILGFGNFSSNNTLTSSSSNSGSKSTASPTNIFIAEEHKLVYALRAALRDFLEVAVFFVVGVFIASFIQVQVERQIFELVSARPLFSVASMQIFAFLLGLCSTSDAFIAANLNVPLDSRLAFLVFGPMFDIKLIALYVTIFRKRFVLYLGLFLFIITALLCSYWWHVLAPENF